MAGISIEKIVNFFEKETDDDFKKMLLVFFRRTM